MQNIKFFWALVLIICAFNNNLQAFKVINNTNKTLNLELTEAGPRPASERGNLKDPIKLNKKPHQLTIKPKETIILKLQNCNFLYLVSKKESKIGFIIYLTKSMTTNILLGIEDQNKQELQINNDWGLLLVERATKNDNFFNNDFEAMLLNPQNSSNLKILQKNQI